MKKPRHKTPSAAKRARAEPTTATGRDHPSDCGRWPIRRKTEVVPRIFHGETLDALSRKLGVTRGMLADLRDEALASMSAGLQSREPDHCDGFVHDPINLN